MTLEGLGIHHLHKRKRIHGRDEKYPSNDKLKRFIDIIIYPIGLLAPMMMLPQVYKIYSLQDASDIAMISWVLLTVPAVLWILYGSLHKEKAIIICNAVWIIIYLLIIAATIMY